MLDSQGGCVYTRKHCEAGELPVPPGTGADDEVLALLQGSTATTLGFWQAGRSLIPLMNFRLSQPAHLVALTGVEELRYVTRRRPGARRRRRRASGGRRARSHRQRASSRCWSTRCGWWPIRPFGIAAPCAAASRTPIPQPSFPPWRSRSGRRSSRIVASDWRATCERGGLLSGRPSPPLLRRTSCSQIRFPLSRAGGHAILECARTHGNFALAGAVCSLRLDEARRAGMSRSWSSARVLDQLGSMPAASRG